MFGRVGAVGVPVDEALSPPDYSGAIARRGHIARPPSVPLAEMRAHRLEQKVSVCADSPA